MESRSLGMETGRVRSLRMWLGIIGVVFIFAGLWGFVDPSFFGLFELTTGHNWIHLLTGALYAYIGFAPTSLNVVTWVARIGGLFYVFLGIVAFFFPEGTLLPLIELGVNENVFHLVMGALIAAIGFALPTHDHAHERVHTTT